MKVYIKNNLNKLGDNEMAAVVKEEGQITVRRHMLIPNMSIYKSTNLRGSH